MPTLLAVMSDRPDPFGAQQTDDPVYADNRNFFKVEQWSVDDQHIEALIYAGNRLDRARQKLDELVKKRPAGRYTIRQRARVLAKWPEI